MELFCNFGIIFNEQPEPVMRLNVVLGDFDARDHDDVINRAYRRAVECVLSSGDADDDSRLHENMARHVMDLVQVGGEINFLLLTNRAIARYQAQRADAAAKRRRTANRRKSGGEPQPVE